jgi:chitosanase
MFSDRDKLIALAIVHIFETGKVLGDYSAVAVLDDGAGISYGINQFTHRSGSLYQVIEAYLDQKPSANVDMITRALPLLRLTTGEAIRQCSINTALKSALTAAGSTSEMRRAQQQVMVERYLQPAIDACDGSNFVLPLSLAVIYDSINHGSYEHIRDRVSIDRSEHPNAIDFECAWISDYVTERDQWLASVPRLASTRYRTRFFLNQIKLANWQLKLPVRANGVDITDAMFPNSAAAPVVQPTNSDASVATSADQTFSPSVSAEIGQPPTIISKAFSWLWGK